MAIGVMNNDDARRTCWVCFATDEDDATALWVKPCLCRGSSKWVHQICIQRWIDEKQRGCSTEPVSCPQCGTQYKIIYPPYNKLVSLLSFGEVTVNKTCPFLAGGIFIGSIYWTAVTYGAVTVMQVLGHKEGLNVMEKADPLFLLMGLPAIPVGLVLGKMVRWEDYMLRMFRKYTPKLPLLNTIFQYGTLEREPADIRSSSDATSVTRILCGALILPTIATMVGKFLFSGVESNFQRTLQGGIVFIVIKGALKIYYKQQHYLQQAQRKIVDYNSSDAM